MATVEKRNNAYRIVVSAGYDITGKQIKRRMTWVPTPGMTDKQIAKELERQKVMFEEKVRSGQVLASSTRFSAFADYWMKEYAEKNLRPSTISRYKDMLERINAAIGNIRLDRLQPNHLMQFYNALSEGGIRRDIPYKSRVDMPALLKQRNLSRQELSEQSGVSIKTVYGAVLGKNIAAKSAVKLSETLGMKLDKVFEVCSTSDKLSGKTILHHHRLISSILEKAVKWQVIFSNPCSRVEVPKVDTKEAEYLDEVQAQELIRCLQSEPLKYRAMVIVLLYTGMRRGELCGLEWSSIDFKNSLIDINKSSLYLPEHGIFDDETKTAASKRVMKIPSEAVTVLQQLRREQIAERLKLGDKWIDTNKVFTRWNGEPIHPDSVTGWFARFIKRNNLPPIHLHSLRHTNATLLIASGADLRTVSKRLGHSNMTTTGKIYAHAIQSADERAAEMLGDILNPIKNRA